MDTATRNETIRALAAASAAEIRSRPERALRAHSAAAGELEIEDTSTTPTTITPCTDRPLPLEFAPPHPWARTPDGTVRARPVIEGVKILR